MLMILNIPVDISIGNKKNSGIYNCLNDDMIRLEKIIIAAIFNVIVTALENMLAIFILFTNSVFLLDCDMLFLLFIDIRKKLLSIGVMNNNNEKNLFNGKIENINKGDIKLAFKINEL